MQRHKLDFRNKKHQDQLATFDRVLAGCDAQPAEQRQKIDKLDEFRGQAAAAHASHERIASLRADLKAELSNRTVIFRNARQNAVRVAGELAANAKFEPAAMQAAGLALAASKTMRLGPPGAPDHFRIEPTDSVGEAMLRWKRPLRRCSFEVQWHTDPPNADNWQHKDICFRQSYLARGLLSGAKCWFRVRAANTAGYGPWSNPVSVRIK